MTASKPINLRDLAMKAAQNAYSPYSGAKVGCALITDKGNVYTGCNIENSSFGGTVCAERVAMWNAISHGEKRISQLYVYTEPGWPPCGICRQVMAEFAMPNMEVIIGNAKGEETRYPLKDIFPLAFTPDHMQK